MAQFAFVPRPLLLRHQLGVGGIRAVYLAEDQRLAGKLVAIKQNTETRPDIQVQFNHEAVLLANLKHPALPAVTDHFIERDGSRFLVIEYIEDKDLAETLDARGDPLSEAMVLEWIATVIDVLEYLYSRTRPILYRDVKPANIKLKTDGQIYLVDFGQAKLEESGQGHALLQQAMRLLNSMTVARARAPIFMPWASPSATC